MWLKTPPGSLAPAKQIGLKLKRGRVTRGDRTPDQGSQSPFPPLVIVSALLCACSFWCVCTPTNSGSLWGLRGHPKWGARFT